MAFHEIRDAVKVDPFYLGGLVALALGFTLHRLRQRRKRHHSNTSFRPSIDADGNFIELSLSKRLPATQIRTDRTWRCRFRGRLPQYSRSCGRGTAKTAPLCKRPIRA